MHRVTGDYRHQWIYTYLLSASADEASECLEPTFVRVLKHVAGPFEDGSVRKQVSDGDLFVDALFSSKSIEYGILCDYSQIVDGCELLLRRYRVRYEMPAVSQNCVGGQMVLVVDECKLMTFNRVSGPGDGFARGRNPSFCMTRPELQERLRSRRRLLLHLQTAAEGSSSSSSAVESDVAVSLLMGKMSEDGTTRAQPTDGLCRVVTFVGPPDLSNFLISDEDQLRLDNIEEWLSDFVPAEERLPFTSRSNAAIQSHPSSSPRLHRQSPPSLHAAGRPKILCDASVQATLCVHDAKTGRPVTAEVGVQVGDSLAFNTQRGFTLGREEEMMWSSGSSLRLSCDEEPNDLQRGDPNLEMLGQRLVSSDSSADMTVDDESPETTAFPPSSPVAIVPATSSGKMRPEEPTLDPFATSVPRRSSEPERLDPLTGSATESRFLQSTQIDYFSSQHCPVEPDFPLSPVRRSGQTIRRSTQSFRPIRVEIAPVVGDGIGGCVDSSSGAGNVSYLGNASDGRDNFFVRRSVPVHANVAKGGTVPRGGNAPNV